MFYRTLEFAGSVVCKADYSVKELERGNEEAREAESEDVKKVVIQAVKVTKNLDVVLKAYISFSAFIIGPKQQKVLQEAVNTLLKQASLLATQYLKIIE